MYIGGISGGLIAAILINIPGTPSSIATTFDGYPMSQKGEAGSALGIAILYSFLGTLVGCFVLIFLAPPLARFAVTFGSYEYFAIALFALMLVAGLASGNLLKGSASAAIGLLIAMIGLAPVDAYQRFTFGFHSLDSGLSLLPVLLGLFAVAEVLKFAENPTGPEKTSMPKVRLKGFFGVDGAQFRNYLPNFLRSSAIGVGVGLLPGIGAAASNMLAYLAARSASKEPETFGKGNPQGIVATEASNNAGIGAAMVPLIALGIPGDSVTALLLGGFLIHGIQPGPLMFAINGDLVYSVFTALGLAAVAMLIIQYFGIHLFIRILSVPKNYLLATVLLMCIVGAYATNNRLFDVWTLLAFGVLGHLMNRFDYPLPPLILGFILGPVIEKNLRSALMSSQGEIMPFFERPITAFFLCAIVFYIGLTIVLSLRKKRAAAQTNTGSGNPG
ncbi:MAG: tripartite tricarboxylate transporter permease [Pseudomonadota bacterium]